MAAAINIQQGHCSAAIKRLQRKRFIVRTCDAHTGEQYFLVNPDLVAVGGSQRRGYLLAQFDDVLGRKESDG